MIDRLAALMRRLACAGLLALGGTALALGCALGPEQEPGCQSDAECGEGFTCRAGACFRNTTDASAPEADAAAD